jgi:hypothetical protein
MRGVYKMFINVVMIIITTSGDSEGPPEMNKN